MYSSDIFAYFIVPTLAATTTMIVASYGLKIKRKNSYSRRIMTIIGALFGFLAFLIVVKGTFLLYIHPQYYIRIGPSFILAAFLFGGFLGPLVGAIVGFKKPIAR